MSRSGLLLTFDLQPSCNLARVAVHSYMDQLRLLRAENAFYRACAAVRQSGVELQQVRGYLLQELLAIEVEKRGRLDRETSETIKELQVSYEFGGDEPP